MPVRRAGPWGPRARSRPRRGGEGRARHTRGDDADAERAGHQRGAGLVLVHASVPLRSADQAVQELAEHAVPADTDDPAGTSTLGPWLGPTTPALRGSPWRSWEGSVPLTAGRPTPRGKRGRPAAQTQRPLPPGARVPVATAAHPSPEPWDVLPCSFTRPLSQVFLHSVSLLALPGEAPDSCCKEAEALRGCEGRAGTKPQARCVPLGSAHQRMPPPPRPPAWSFPSGQAAAK